jgi:hypothetical protein
VYVRTANDPRVLLVRKERVDAFRATFRQLRENRALPFEFRSVDRFVVTQPDGEYEFGRQAGDWVMIRPFAAPGDSAAIQDWLYRIAGWPVADHLDGWSETRARRLFGEVSIRLRIRTTDGESHVLEIGGTDQDAPRPDTVTVHLPASDEYFLLDHERAESLGLPYGRLLQTTLLAVDPATITGLSVDSPAERWTIFHSPRGEWRWVRQQLSVRLSARKITEYLARLARLPAVEYLPPPTEPEAYGLAAPRLRLFLDQESGRGIDVSIGREDARHVYVRRQDFPCIIVVEQAAWQELRFDPAAWIIPEN